MHSVGACRQQQCARQAKQNPKTILGPCGSPPTSTPSADWRRLAPAAIISRRPSRRPNDFAPGASWSRHEILELAPTARTIGKPARTSYIWVRVYLADRRHRLSAGAQAPAEAFAHSTRNPAAPWRPAQLTSWLPEMRSACVARPTRSHSGGCLAPVCWCDFMTTAGAWPRAKSGAGCVPLHSGGD